LGVPPGHYSEDEYYSTPIDNLRTYPVYDPRFEPPGYREWMKAQGPQPLIDPKTLRTRADWIAAGRRVFEELDTEVTRTDDPVVIKHFSDAAEIDRYRDATHDATTKDGIILDYRWVVDHDGALKISASSCSGCHTRLMPDGSLLPGAPSNYDLASSPAAQIILSGLSPKPAMPAGEEFYQFYGVPWRSDDAHARMREYSDEQMDELFGEDSGAPAGTVFDRFNGSPLYTTRMADLNGVKDRRFLDATGTHANRGPEDIARYGILVEFADNGVFGSHRMMPEMNQRLRVRPSDEAMYALGLYIYSLEPPASPHSFDDLARRGKEIFDREGCAGCHPPPAYTNNALVPVPGFDPPANDPATQRLNISRVRVDTDPGLALRTRKGTGYYRVPSLRGLWYRGLFEHSGSVASLEDWFDPARLRGDYVPSGWRGPGVKTRAVPGHLFGLDLPPADKQALIAFLMTL
jgi:mono/diheme cytochrome c family protein